MYHRYGVYVKDSNGAFVRSFVRKGTAQAYIDREHSGSEISGLEVRQLAVPLYLESRRSPLSGRWVDLGSDVNWSDHGGKWGRPAAEPGKWWVLSFENTADWGDGPADGKYHGELAEVNVANPPADQLKGAFSYVGMSADGLDEYGAAIPPAVLAAMTAEALHSYGAKAPIDSETGNAAWGILARLRALAGELDRDAAALEARMDRPVNAIGSSAREYQAGDIGSAILRGVSEGDPKAELMLRMGMVR